MDKQYKLIGILKFESTLTKWILLMVLSTMMFGGSYLLLKPVDPSKQTAKNFKYMHCTKCGKEQSYNPNLAGGKCTRCKPGSEAGELIATEESFSGRSNDPWKKFKSALIIEFVIFLWTLIRLITKSRQVKKTVITMVMHCPKCQWKLRFKPKSVGEIGMCPRCKKKFIFPNNAPEYHDGQLVDHVMK